MDLQRELERDLGHGPSLPTPQQRLAAGRRALRRRRIAVATGVAGVAAAVALPVAILVGGTSTAGRDVAPVAPSPSRSIADDGLRLESAVPVSVGRKTFDLVFEDDATVERRIDGVARGIVGWSAALEISQGERYYWVLVGWDELGSDLVYDEVDPGRSGFEDWVAAGVPKLERQYAPGRARSAEGLDLQWDGERFVGSGGVEVVEQRAGIDLGEEFAPAGATTAAALVDLSGYRLLALYRELPGVDGQILTFEELPTDDLEQSLEEMRQRYQTRPGAR